MYFSGQPADPLAVLHGPPGVRGPQVENRWSKNFLERHVLYIQKSDRFLFPAGSAYGWRPCRSPGRAAASVSMTRVVGYPVWCRV